jgi:pimeloyl-ACP methyl ester carboxylesterase
MPDFEHIQVGEINLRAVIQGEGPLVVLVHGFPDSWYTWRHQLGPIAAAGFRVCAIDVRGYGGSDKPHEVEAYTLEQISNDVARLIAILSPDKPAVLIGHDWGATISWTTALVHRERVRAVAGLSVPYTGIPDRSLSEVIDKVYTSKGKFFYMHYFEAEGVAEAEMEVDVRASLRRFFYAWSGDVPAGSLPTNKVVGDPMFLRVPDPDTLPSWLTDADLDYYVGEFERSGFRGPLNRYRNSDRDFHFLQSYRGQVLEQPALFIAGERDSVLSMFGDRLPAMRAALPNLQGLHLLPGCGHWTQHERADTVTELLVTWLRGL